MRVGRKAASMPRVKGVAEELMIKQGEVRGVSPVAEPVFSGVARPMNADPVGAAAKQLESPKPA